MSIERTCKNCFLKDFFGDEETWTCKHCDTNNSKYDFFKPNEKSIRQDERRKVIEELWLTNADPNKKLYFEKDGYKFKLSLVPIIEEKENNDVNIR